MRTIAAGIVCTQKFPQACLPIVGSIVITLASGFTITILQQAIQQLNSYNFGAGLTMQKYQRKTV